MTLDLSQMGWVLYTYYPGDLPAGETTRCHAYVAKTDGTPFETEAQADEAGKLLTAGSAPQEDFMVLPAESLPQVA